MAGQLDEQERIAYVINQMERELSSQRKTMERFRRCQVVLILSLITVIILTILEAFIFPQLEPYNNAYIGALNLFAVCVSIYAIKDARSFSNVGVRRKLIALNVGCLLLNLGLAVAITTGFI